MVRDSLWGGTAWIRRGCVKGARYVEYARSSPETGETRSEGCRAGPIGCDAILAPTALGTNRPGHGTHHSQQRTTRAVGDSDSDVVSARTVAAEMTAGAAASRSGVVASPPCRTMVG